MTEPLDASPLPRVRVIFTGGTIASRADASGHAVAATAPRDLLAQVPGLESLATIDVAEVARVNGWNVTPEIMFETVEHVRQATLDGVDGIVVTHGTDTLEETAFLLDLHCRHLTASTGVVVTGAMRAGDELGADGPRNLLDAVALAASPAARDRGVLVSFHERIYLANRVRKLRTTGMNPFDSMAGAAGGFRVGRPELFAAPSAVSPLVTNGLGAPVPVIAVATGDDGAVVEWHLERGAPGLVIMGTGAGNVPGTYQDAIIRAAACVPVVITSRCLGLTAPIYSGPGGGAVLLAGGVIDGGGLSAAQARLALMTALAVDDSPLAVAAWFQNLLGRDTAA